MATKVLVVDDELDTLNLLRTLLEITGFEPVTTLNSVEAITLAEIEDVDVALLDIMMPDLDGFQLCIMMRQHKTLRQLPIIFVTAYDALDLEDRRKASGADYVVRKPIDIDELTSVITDLYNKRQAGELPVPRHQPSTAELLAKKHKDARAMATQESKKTSRSHVIQANKKTTQSSEDDNNSTAQASRPPIKPKRPPTPS